MGRRKNCVLRARVWVTVAVYPRYSQATVDKNKSHNKAVYDKLIQDGVSPKRAALRPGFDPVPEFYDNTHSYNLHIGRRVPHSAADKQKFREVMKTIESGWKSYDP